MGWFIIAWLSMTLTSGQARLGPVTRDRETLAVRPVSGPPFAPGLERATAVGPALDHGPVVW